MKWDAAQKLADAVLYEGYLLYPYRASALKNQFRWQFGVLAPRGSQIGDAPPNMMQTEVLFEPGARPLLDLKIRFLQLQTRAIERLLVPPDQWQLVERLVVDERELLTWEEAVPREFVFCELSLAEPLVQQLHNVHVDSGKDVEIIRNASGDVVGRVVRERAPLSAAINVSVVPANAFWKLTVQIENSTPLPDGSDVARLDLVRHSLISTHALLALQDAAFLSALDPPADTPAGISTCRNLNTFPVLVGEPPARDLMLSAPIILYDYPAVAPESAGDLFDATEIDEMLTLRLMTLTDAEQREARITDAHSRQLIDRTNTLPTEAIERLHGAVRYFGEVTKQSVDISAWESFLNPPGADAAQSIEIGGQHVSKGTRVRLRPRKGADAMDMFLAGQTATVTGVYIDLEDQAHIAVTVERDQAADLHEWYGRYFYFRPEEIEVLADIDASITTAAQPRVLIAGIGNVFLGDDGFGPAVIERLRTRSMPAYVHTRDFGIRGVHLAYELLEARYDMTIIVDCTSRGEQPGTVYVIEPVIDATPAANADAHTMSVEAVLATVKRMGGDPGEVFVVGCEPQSLEPNMGLSDCVANALDAAADAVLNLIAVPAR